MTAFYDEMLLKGGLDYAFTVAADAARKFNTALDAQRAINAGLVKALEAAEEYLDQRANAEYLPGKAAPVGNEEMDLLVEVRAALAVAEEGNISKEYDSRVEHALLHARRLERRRKELTAYEHTYAEGINPEAVPLMRQALEALEEGDPSVVDLARAALAKTKEAT